MGCTLHRGHPNEEEGKENNNNKKNPQPNKVRQVLGRGVSASGGPTEWRQEVHTYYLHREKSKQVRHNKLHLSR